MFTVLVNFKKKFKRNIFMNILISKLRNSIANTKKIESIDSTSFTNSKINPVI